MSEEKENSKRIAKNTLLLYVRMLLLMGIGLFTSRVNLQSLGIEDFGIYNVVGGIVVMFSILSGSLSAAITRFLTFELGKGDKEQLRKTFSSSVTIQCLLSLLVVLLGETVGLWFLQTKMVIPEARMHAAMWVYQFSILTFVVNLISIPYNASIIAHERMSAFAYITLFEAAGKLAIAYFTFISPIDKLIFYAAMMCTLGLLMRLIYSWYCRKHFEECHFQPVFDHTLLKRMFSFAGWNFIGASSFVLQDTGGNILINLFFGPAINAARGVAMQVNTAISGFANNFMTAITPQITKSYAAGQYDYMMRLIFQGARLSFYILLFISLPVLVNTPYLLDIWLDEVPGHSVNFVRLVLIYTLSESLSKTLITAMLATGNIRTYQIVVGGCALMNLPIAYLLLHFGAPAETVPLVAILISVLCELLRVYMLRGMIHISFRAFYKQVYFNVMAVTICAAMLPYLLHHYMPVNFWCFLLSCFVCVICTAISILYVGCTAEERIFVYNKAHIVLQKIHPHA